MSRIELKGLKGLKGLSGREYTAWKNAQMAAGKIDKNTPYKQLEILYNNQQYIKKYGHDAFKQKNYYDRMYQWKYDIIQPAFESAFNSYFDDDPDAKGPNGELYDASKGLGRDFFKYNYFMDLDAKLELLENEDFKTPSEMDAYIEKQKAHKEEVLDKQVQFAPSEAAVALAGYGIASTMLDPIKETYDRKKNTAIIDKIWEKNLERRRRELDPIVSAYFADNHLADLDEEEVNSKFAEAIFAKDKDGGPAYILSAYFNEDGTDKESEVKKFSIDEKRNFLAEKAVYDQYLGPEAGYDALNNKYKKYLNDHQDWMDYTYYLGKDVLISSASYTADQWNSIRRLFLMGQNADVYIDYNGNVVPTADVNSRDGKYYYKTSDGKEVPVHKENMSLIALDDMGKDENGNDRTWINNAQFWTNAEQFGTLDEEELAKYKKLGYSPYKVVYEPGDETDIFYETGKMTSFAIADMAANFIPYAGVAKGAAMMSKAAKMTGAASKALSAAGKTIYLGSRAAQAAHGTIAAFGIGQAYGRGVFGETFANNLQQLEQSVADQAQRVIYSKYNEDSEYKAQVDAKIEEEYQRLAAEQQRQLQMSEGQIIDAAANEEALRAKATQNVLYNETKEWENNFKGTDIYGKAISEAAESASSAALTSAITTGIKYTFVNNWGHKQYLFKSKAQRAAALESKATSGVTETVTSAGKKRLSSKFDFDKFKGKAKVVGKIAASQMWGGAWTNATDELQSAGGRRINETRMGQFLNGMYDGKALEARYSVIDGVSSYIYGAASGLAEMNTYKAGLVGGLGSLSSVAINAASIAPIVTNKESRREFINELKENWKSKKFGAVANMFISNGVLNEYFNRKQASGQLQNKIALLNKMMDEADDFSDIDQAIALDMASIDATNMSDIEALNFLKAVRSIDALNALQENKELAQLSKKSSVIQKAMDSIDKLSDPSKLSKEEAEDYLSQYYAANPSIARSDRQNALALQSMQKNAEDLKDAAKVWQDVSKTIADVENKRGASISPEVKSRLLYRLSLDKFLTRKTADLEERISGTRTSSTEASRISSYGTREHQETHVRDTEKLLKQIEVQIKGAMSTVAVAQKALDDYNATPQNDQGFKRKKKLQDTLDSAKLQVERLNNIKNGLTSELNSFTYEHLALRNAHEYELETRTAPRTNGEVISAEDILRLNPQDRARMLNPDNFDNYSEEQRNEIAKCRTELYFRDPSLLDDVQSQATLTQMVESNRKTSAMMLENPEAAAVQLESDRIRIANEAMNAHADRITTRLAKGLHKYFEVNEAIGVDEKELRTESYKALRGLSRNVLNYLNDPEVRERLGLGFLSGEIERALDWSTMLSNMSNIIRSMKLEEAPRKAFLTSLDKILDETSTREEVINELGKVVESSEVTAEDKAPYEKLLNDLEQLWNQKASTTSMTREERQTVKEESEKEATEEEQRRAESEREAVKEASKPQVSEEDADTSKDDIAAREAAGISEKDTDESKNTGEEAAAREAATGLSEKDMTTDNESTLTPEQVAQAAEEGIGVQLESPPLEEQIAATPQDKVNVIPTPVKSTDQRDTLPQTNDTLLGNAMYGYELTPLKTSFKQVKRKGKSPTDKMSRFFTWLDTAGIKLQDIIDTELNDIMQLNPEVYPMFVKVENNATDDAAMGSFALLTVEYTPEVAKVHIKDNGGVITSNGKQYLVIGTLGFSKGNKAQSATLLRILNTDRQSWFNAHPSERFFVDTSKHTQIQSISNGTLVRQLETDEKVQIRSVSELLADKERNPKGLTMGDLKWGIQYEDRFATVNVSGRNRVWAPSDSPSNLGSVFLLVEAADGSYIPTYIRPVKYSEIKQGKLKSRIDNIFDRLTSTNFAERSQAWNELRQICVCSQEGSWVLYGDASHNTVTVQVNGIKRQTHNLNSPSFDRAKLLRELKEEADFRINITVSSLSNETDLADLDEAGALTTDIAKLGVSNASYNVYTIDADGNPVIKAPVENEAPSLEARSDLSKAQKKLASERIGNATYRKHEDGNWYTETDDLVTDPRLVEQLNYRNLIRTRDLKPDKIIGIDEIFIVNNDKNNPLVLIRRNGNKISAMSKEGAIKTINDVNTELAQKAMQERVQKELEREESEAKALENMSEEDKQKAADEGESVDLREALTDEQITKQIMGDFSSEPSSKSEPKLEPESELTPQQKVAAEQFAKVQAESDNLELTKDEKYYEDLTTGELIPRVTTVAEADTLGTKFPEGSKWILPSTTLGTGVHKFVEDLLFDKAGNPENYAERYPNATNDELKHIASEVEKLKKRIGDRKLTIAGTEVKVSGEVEVFDESSKVKKTLRIAGSIDLLLYDEDGKFIIFDFKTKRGTISQKDLVKWALQTSLYNQILQEKHGLVTHDPEIVPFLLKDTKTRDHKYPIPEGERVGDTIGTAVYTTNKEGQLSLNGTAYKDMSADLGNNVTLTDLNITPHIEYSKLSKDIQAKVKTVESAPTEVRKPTITEKKKVAKEKLARVETALNSFEVRLWSDTPLDNVTITVTHDGFNSPHKSSRLWRTAKDHRDTLHVKLGETLANGVKVEYRDRYGNTYIEIPDAKDGEVKSAILFPIGGRGGDNFTLHFYTTLAPDTRNILIDSVSENPNREDLIDYISRLLKITNNNLLYLSYRDPARLNKLREEAYTEPAPSSIQPEPIRSSEDINRTGSKSLAELQNDKTLNTALDIIRSREFGKRALTLLRTKFPNMPTQISELERFLQNNKIPTVNISDVEKWLKLIEECR